MLLEELIHAFWRDSTPLNAAVPLERFFTGTSTAVPLPCVFLATGKEEVLFHTNRKEPWKKRELSFELHHEHFEEGARIAMLIEESFNRLRLPGIDERTSYRFSFLRGENRPQKDGEWVFVRFFKVVG